MSPPKLDVALICDRETLLASISYNAPVPTKLVAALLRVQMIKKKKNPYVAPRQPPKPNGSPKENRVTGITIFGTVLLSWCIAFLACYSVRSRIAPGSLKDLEVACESFFIALIFSNLPTILFCLLFRPSVNSFSIFAIGFITIMLVFIFSIYSFIILSSIG